jgi:hypothetical protein
MSEPIFTSNNKYPKPERRPGRIDIFPADYDAAIEDQGVRVRIVPAVLCPNRTSLEDTNHVLDCPVCNGDEVVNLESECEESWAYIQGIKLDKNFQAQGIFDMKDAMITVQSHVKLYYWYKVEIVDFPSTYNQLLKRGAGDLDKLRYMPACDLAFDQWLLVDRIGQTYEKNVDYKTDEQNIRWLGVKRPAAGTLYSFSYPIRPIFRVLELLHENRYYYFGNKREFKQGVFLPQQAVVRWDYLAKRSGSAELAAP